MPRVPNDVVRELIDNDGCRRGALTPINSTGIVRLALDLQEARARIADLERLILSAGSLIATTADHIQAEVRAADQDRANKTTRLDRGKRTKK